MEQIQKATLTLRTHDIPLNGSDAKGSCDQFRTIMTWNNINLRLLLGDMYDKFDNFNLKLVNIASDDDRILSSGTYINAAGEDHSDRIVTINLSGVNMLNSTYDSATGNMSSKTVLTTYEFYESFSKELTNSIVSFTKGNEMCNLTLEYLDVYTNTKPATATSFPQMVFLFHIYGIPKDKNPYF